MHVEGFWVNCWDTQENVSFSHVLRKCLNYFNRNISLSCISLVRPERGSHSQTIDGERNKNRFQVSQQLPAALRWQIDQWISKWPLISFVSLTVCKDRGQTGSSKVPPKYVNPPPILAWGIVPKYFSSCFLAGVFLIIYFCSIWV